MIRIQQNGESLSCDNRGINENGESSLEADPFALLKVVDGNLCGEAVSEVLDVVHQSGVVRQTGICVATSRASVFGSKVLSSIVTVSKREKILAV